MQPRKCIKQKSIRPSAQKVVWVAYERWSFKRGSNYRDLAGIL